MKRFLGIGLLSLAVVIGGCSKFFGKSNDSKKQTSHQLSILSPHPKMIQQEWIPRFEKYYHQRTGHKVTVEWISQGGTSESLRFIQNQFSASPGGIDIDIFWGGGVRPYLKLAEKGYLLAHRMPKAILSKIPSTIAGVPLYDPKHRWFGSALATFGIAMNKEILEREKISTPSNWEDLGSPEYFNKVVSADPRQSGAAHMIYSIILQAYPWEKAWQVLTRVVANIRSFLRYSADVSDSLIAGDAAVGLVIDFYAWDMIARYGSKHFGFVMPQGLTIINPDAVAILKGATNLSVAKAFVEFLLGAQNQRMWILPAGSVGGPKRYTLGRIPVVPTLLETLKKKSVVTINPYKTKVGFKYDSNKGKVMWGVINDMVGALLIDSSKNLRKAWRRVIKRGVRPQDVSRLGEVPLSEKAALDLAAKWEDPVLRNKTITEWQTFAKNKYAKVLKELTL